MLLTILLFLFFIALFLFLPSYVLFYSLFKKDNEADIFHIVGICLILGICLITGLSLILRFLGLAYYWLILTPLAGLFFGWRKRYFTKKLTPVDRKHILLMTVLILSVTVQSFVLLRGGVT